MATATKEERIAEEVARLLVAKRQPRIRADELETIFKELGYGDKELRDFTSYIWTPQGRDLFRKTIRAELRKAGYRPKGEGDTMFFNVPEAREQLIREGFVYTLRPRMRKTGWDVAYYGSYYKREKIGDVWVSFIKEIKDMEELKPYFYASGFKKLTDWWEAAEGSRFLFRVSFKRWERP